MREDGNKLARGAHAEELTPEGCGLSTAPEEFEALACIAPPPELGTDKKVEAGERVRGVPISLPATVAESNRPCALGDPGRGECAVRESFDAPRGSSGLVGGRGLGVLLDGSKSNYIRGKRDNRECVWRNVRITGS